MRKVVLYIASSLDGFIATHGYSLDWLFSAERKGDNGYSKFFDTVDIIVLGRTTYDWILEHEPNGFPYVTKECYVFSRTKSVKADFVTFTNDDISSFIQSLKNNEGKDIWLVGGGDLIQSFMKEDLIDRVVVTIAPTLLGGGIPLFKDSGKETHLILRNVNQYNQLIELDYDVIR
jgi:dihydrofolate reductase